MIVFNAKSLRFLPSPISLGRKYEILVRLKLCYLGMSILTFLHFTKIINPKKHWLFLLS